MKLIEAYIPPDILPAVRQLLASRGVEELVASEMAVEVGGYGERRWTSVIPDFVPQIKLELAASDEQAAVIAQEIHNAIGNRRAARRVQIAIGHLDQVVTIETGERGVRAFADGN